MLHADWSVLSGSETGISTGTIFVTVSHLLTLVVQNYTIWNSAHTSADISDYRYDYFYSCLYISHCFLIYTYIKGIFWTIYKIKRCPRSPESDETSYQQLPPKKRLDFTDSNDASRSKRRKSSMDKRGNDDDDEPAKRQRKAQKGNTTAKYQVSQKKTQSILRKRSLFKCPLPQKSWCQNFEGLPFYVEIFKDEPFFGS